MLDTRNIRTTRLNRSLDFKNQGPFKIVCTINNLAYELELLKEIGRVYNVFYLQLLYLVSSNPLLGQTIDSKEPAAIYLDVVDNKDYVVKAIEDCRVNKTLKNPALRKKGLLQYRVRQASYLEGPNNLSQEPYINLLGSENLVYDFYRCHPTKLAVHAKFKTLAS